MAPVPEVPRTDVVNAQADARRRYLEVGVATLKQTSAGEKYNQHAGFSSGHDFNTSLPSAGFFISGASMKLGIVKHGLMVALVALLCGCYAAQYKYRKTAAGDVELTIRSNRDLPAGFVGSIGADGSLTSNVGAATGGQTSLADVAQLLTVLQAIAKPAAGAAPVSQPEQDK